MALPQLQKNCLETVEQSEQTNNIISRFILRKLQQPTETWFFLMFFTFSFLRLFVCVNVLGTEHWFGILQYTITCFVFTCFCGLFTGLTRSLGRRPRFAAKAPAWFGAVTQGWSDCTVYCGWMNSCMTYTCCTIRAQSTLNNRVSETTLRRVIQGCRLNMSLHSAVCSRGQVRSGQFLRAC